MRNLIRLPLGVFGSSLLLLMFLLVDSRQAPPPAPYVVFSSDRTGNWELYRMRTDGKDSHRLTYNNLGPDEWPDWSPDGAWIAFRSLRFGSQQIYRTQPNGRLTAQLTNLPRVDPPHWSPDGRWLVFTGEENGVPGLYRLDPYSGEVERLLARRNSLLSFSWTGNPNWIIVETIVFGDLELFRLHSSGSPIEPLTTTPGKDTLATTSPDGQWVAFFSERNGGVNVMPITGEPAVYLSEALEHTLIWSADSEWLFFIAIENNERGLYRIRRDGTQRYLVSALQGSEGLFTLSPDGRWMAYTQYRDIYLIRLVDGKSINLTQGQGANSTPAWGPIVDLRWNYRYGVGLGCLALILNICLRKK